MGAIRSTADRTKLAFFAVLVIALLWVIWNDERFLVMPDHPEWQHIAPFKWLLLVHGVFGAAALLLGAAQFSGRLRRRPGMHKWLGRGYVVAAVVASLFAGYIGPRYEPATMRVEMVFQAYGWLLTTLAGWWFMRRRNLAQHRLWMMRSYGFALIFVSDRVPDGVPGFQWNDQLAADVLWGLVIAALVVPDLIVMLIGPAKWPSELVRPAPPPPR